MNNINHEEICDEEIKDIIIREFDYTNKKISSVRFANATACPYLIDKYCIMLVKPNGSSNRVIDFPDMIERIEIEMILRKIQLRSINKIKKWWREVNQ